jgi:NAD-dependent dihydropyrimidine dehydrogenase PreA subunit
MITRVHALFFSPTLTTRKVTEAIAKGVADTLNAVHNSNIQFVPTDVTTPALRSEAAFGFDNTTLVVFGVPVYIGRVPNLVKDYLSTIKGNGAIGVPVVVYGNRAYDDALLELKDMMEGNEFKCIAGAAFIGEHSFSTTLGGGRPNDNDLEIAEAFGKEIAEKLSGYNGKKLEVPGNYPYKFFDARNTQNKGIDIRKVQPLTNPDKCNNCGLCATLCPMGSINPHDCSEVTGKCIKCCACIKRCPSGAKYFTDPTYLEHKEILEKNFTHPAKTPELFW